MIKQSLFFCAASVLALGHAASASAQATGNGEDAASSSGQVEEIIVTAQRRAENLQSVPVAVTAVSAASLATKGIDSTDDLNSVIPSLSFTSVVGTATPRIRGVGTAVALGGNENAVATYIDGVYIASAAASVLSFNNIEQISVLKGPQGTLFGRNATGGLIQITTLDPSETMAANLNLGYGNYETVSANAYVTAGLVPGVAADVAVYYNNQMKGVGHNLFTGKEVGSGEDFAVRSKLKIELGDSTVARLSLDYARTDSNTPMNRLKDGSRAQDGSTFPGGKFDINANVDPRFLSEQGGVSLDLRHELGTLNLVSITAYRKSKLDLTWDIDNLPLALTRGVKIQPDRQFSQEIQLVSDDKGALKWMVGAYYFNAASKYDPQVVDLQTAGRTINIFSRQATESASLFGQATLEVGPGTSITGGLRYTWETKDYDAHAVTVTAAGSTTSPDVSGRLKARKLTWRAALDHKITDDILAYVSYNRGFKSGGFNPQAFTAPLVSFRPEVLDAVEVGLKSELFDRRLRFNSALFYYDYQDIQLQAYLNGLSQIYNAASAKIRGFDADITAVPIPDLTLTAGVSIIDSKFGTFSGASISTPRPTGGNTISQGSAKGNMLPLTPKWTLNLGADYRLRLSSGSVLLSANYYHSDGWFAEPDNRLEQRPYDVVNGSITWFVDADEGLSLKVWGKNLTNKAYAVQMYTQASGDGVNLAQPRTYGVTLGARF